MKSNALSQGATRTKFVVNCGLLIAISIVLKILFEMYIPLGGFPSLRLNLTALPIMFSGIVLGPVAGFVVGFISDLLCFFIKPAGPFFIGFTLAMGFTGMIPGLIWRFLKKREIKHLEWFNLAFIAVAAAILIFTGIFTVKDGTVYYGENALNPLLLILLALLMLAYVLYPIFVVRRSHGLSTGYRSDYLLFTVSISQLVTSIILNTWFLTILYGQAVTVLLPARIVTNVFLIPLYTIALAGLLKALARFVSTR